MKSIINKITLSIIFTSLICVISTAQDKSEVKSKRETAIEMSYNKKADKSKIAVALVTAKNEAGKFIPANNVQVNFYAKHNNDEQLIKSANTNNKGEANILLPKDLPLNDSMYFNIIAKIENNNQFENAQEQMHFKEANLSFSLDSKDTNRMVIAKVTEMSKDGKEIPVKGVELKFYVCRLFGTMPASEDNNITTDDKGEASFAYPKNIPGSTEGVITLVAKIENNEKFGSIENKVAEPWGTVLAIEKEPFPRALWEPTAPFPLVITISSLFGGVWLVYFFLFYQLKKIKEETKIKTVKN